MKLKDYVVVTGMPGVQKIVATRNNGMLVEDLDTGKVRLASVRKHQFSPLDSMSMYVTGEEDSVPLKDVFQSMLDKLNETPPIDPDSPTPELRKYFTTILPNHDPDRVHGSDIKKAIRWFKYMNDRGLLTGGDDSEEE